MSDALANLWSVLVSTLGVRLFSIGDTPVTPSGVLQVLVVIAAAALVSKAARGAIARAARRWPATGQSTLYSLSRVVHYLILAVGTVFGLSTIGVGFTNLAVLLGALGIGIGFGLQDVVANFIAGLIVLFERHLRIGDFIELESGVVGEVREIRIRATRVVTNDNIDILVPNSEFVRGRVVNWTLDEADRRVHVPFGVAYGSDKEQVRLAGLRAADRVPLTMRDIPGRAPQVWLVRFGESSLDFELIVWVTLEGVKRPGSTQAAYLWELHTALLAAGIEIPFPQRDLHVKSVTGLDGEAARRLLGTGRKVDRGRGPEHGDPLETSGVNQGR